MTVNSNFDLSQLYPRVLDLNDYNSCSSEESLRSSPLSLPSNNITATATTSTTTTAATTTSVPLTPIRRRQEEEEVEEEELSVYGHVTPDDASLHSFKRPLTPTNFDPPISTVQLRRAQSDVISSSIHARAIRRRSFVKRILHETHEEQHDDPLMETRRRIKFDSFYQLIRKVREDFSHAIWDCVDLETKIPYSVKILFRHKLMETDVEALHNEACVLEHLRPPQGAGVVRLVDFFAEESYFYLVTERLEANASTLWDKISERTWNEDEARVFMQSLLQGVKYMHSRNVVHRDLKPQSIYCHDLRARIGDFCYAARMSIGAAAQVPSMNDRSAMRHFVAPEILQGVPYDSQLDMWSVGAILYYCLTGKPPFLWETREAHLSRADLYQRIAKGTLVFSLDAPVSQHAKNFIASLMKLDPDERLTPDEALQHVWMQHPDVAPPVPKKRRWKKPLTLKSKLNAFLKKRHDKQQQQQHQYQQHEQKQLAKKNAKRDEDARSTSSQTISTATLSLATMEYRRRMGTM